MIGFLPVRVRICFYNIAYLRNSRQLFSAAPGKAQKTGQAKSLPLTDRGHTALYLTVSVAVLLVSFFPLASVMMQRYFMPLYLASTGTLSVAVFAEE